MRMVIVEKAGERSPVMPPTAAELARHRWHSTRRGTVSFAGATTLPSVTAAEAFWEGEPGGLTAVIGSTALRAALIGIGLALAGERKNLVKYSVAGALAIEAFVLTSVKLQLAK